MSRGEFKAWVTSARLHHLYLLRSEDRQGSDPGALALIRQRSCSSTTADEKIRRAPALAVTRPKASESERRRLKWNIGSWSRLSWPLQREWALRPRGTARPPRSILVPQRIRRTHGSIRPCSATRCSPHSPKKGIYLPDLDRQANARTPIV